MNDKALENELNTRIAQVESGIPEVQKMNKKDYVQIVVIALLCLLGIIAGAFI